MASASATAAMMGIKSHAKTHIHIPALLYGTAWKKERTAELVAEAVHWGFRGIDTACQPKHYHEPGVGEGLRRAYAEGIVTRQDMFLQTKFTSFDGQDPSNCPYDPRDPLPDQVRRSFETSLRNLGTEYLDSLVLHSPMRSFEDTMTVWRVFEELHKTGKVLSLGISNTYDLSVLQRLYREAEVKPSFLQNRFYEDSGYDLDIRSFCRGHNITYQSFWTLTANPRMLKSAPIMDLAHRYQKTPAQMFFKFVQSIGIVPLTGTTYVKHMREDLDVANIPDLSTEEIVSIERVLYNVRTR